MRELQFIIYSTLAQHAKPFQHENCILIKLLKVHKLNDVFEEHEKLPSFTCVCVSECSFYLYAIKINEPT